MSGLGLSGLISGMDTDTVVEKLMEIESQRVELVQSRKEALEKKQSAWQEVRTSLTTLRSKLDSVRLVSTYRSRTVTLTDDSVATVTASTGASQTTHHLEVVHLATAHAVASDLWESPTAQLGMTGDLTITIGATAGETADEGSTSGSDGTPAVSGKSVTIVATDNLYSIRDKINAAGLGVTAEVVRVSDSGKAKYRLVLTSRQTGSAGAITISGSSDVAKKLGFLDDKGGLAHELVKAQNAKFWLDGILYDDYSTNEITDAVPNLTITLKKAGATESNPDATVATDITVRVDTDKIVSAVQDWVDALNDSLSLLSELTSYDRGTKTAGALQGDSLARSLQTALRSMLSSVVEGLPQGFRQLSDIGITTGRYGTADYGKVLLDTDKLKAKLEADADGVARVLGALRNNVALASNGGKVKASSTMGPDSEHVYAAEDVINGETSSTRFGTAGGGWASGGIPTEDEPEWLQVTFNQATVDQVQLYLASTSNLKSYRIKYKDASGTWQTLAEVQNNSGTIRTFEFGAVSTTDILLEVTGTTDGKPVQGITEVQVLQQNRGAALQMYRYVNTALGSTGSITNRDDAISEQIADIDEQISRLQEQMQAKEEALREKFEAMERGLAELQSQGTLLLAQFNLLWSNSSSSSSR